MRQLAVLLCLSFAVLLFSAGEAPSPWIWAAIAILFLGLFLVNHRSNSADHHLHIISSIYYPYIHLTRAPRRLARTRNRVPIKLYILG